MIKTLSLTNFRKHEKLHLDFTTGLNGIFGPNYRGKSTVLYGILFALGGIRAIPCTTVLRNGANTYKVDLTFHADEGYRVVRTKSTDRLYRGDLDTDENLIANGTTVVNKKIEEILGMSMKRFIQTRFARQKKTDAILLTGANELYAVINEISGADAVESALKLLGDKAKSLDGFLDRVEMPDVKSQETLLADVLDELHEKIKSSAMWKEMSEQQKTDLEAAREALTVLRSEEKLYTRYVSDLGHAQDDLRSAMQARVNAVESATPVDEAMVAEAAELKTRIENLSASLTEISGINMLLEAQRKDMVEITTNIESLKAKKAALVPAIDPQIDMVALADCEKKLDVARAELTIVITELKTLSSELLESACSKCGRAWEDHAEKQLHHDKAVESATKKKRALEDAVLALKAQAEDANRSLQIFTDAQEHYDRTLVSTQQQLNGFEVRENQTATAITNNEIKLAGLCPSGRDALVFERTDCEGKLTDIQKKLRRAEQDQQDIQRAEQREKTANEKLMEVMACERPEFKAGDLDKAVIAERALSDSYMQSSTAHSTTSAQVAALIERRDQLQQAIPLLKETAEKIKTAEGQRSVNKNLTKFLKANRDRYMADIWTVLMAQASQFVQQCTSGAIESIARTDDGDFVYTEDGCTLAISEASGAQASIMGLAMQLALSAAVQPPLDVLLVDEPNADMDPEHSMAVNLLLSATVGQVICVSHSHMDSSVCENVIEL